MQQRFVVTFVGTLSYGADHAEDTCLQLNLQNLTAATNFHSYRWSHMVRILTFGLGYVV